MDAGATVDELFNTRGARYRTLKLKELDLNEEEKIAWMAKENMLIKRPVLMLPGTALVGYDEEKMKQIFSDHIAVDKA
jgi:arsenate reductase-like glutaredoxin family protein